MMSNNKLKSKISGAMMGVAVGDALGATLEFLEKNEGFETFGWLTEMVGGGSMNLRKGQTTDDTDMTIAVAKGILQNPKDPTEAIGQYFMEWYDTDPKDIGISCRQTFANYKKMNNKNWHRASVASHTTNSGRSAGNGTLMRCVPVALFYRNDRELMEVMMQEQSKLTHYDDLASEACIMYGNMIHDFLKGDVNKMKIVERYTEDTVLYKGVYNLSYTDLKPTGYVVDSLRCALWSFLHTKTFEECICMAINLCGDSDTIGAIAGGLAGSYYGIAKVPKRWINKIELREEIFNLSYKLGSYEGE